MKKLALLFLIVTLPLLVACSSGGGSDAALNPYGFVIAAFKSTAVTGLDVRSVIRPAAAGLMYVGTSTGVYSFDSSVATPVFTAVAGAPTNVNKMISDGTNGDFYVCADSGLYKYDATAKIFTLDAGIGAKKVLDFARQTATVYWVGLEDLTATTNSIAKVDTGAATFFGTAQGNTASAVADIYVDTNMVMACGAGDTGKGGLFRYDPSGTQFTRQPVTVGLEKGASLFFLIGTNWYAGGKDSGLVVSTDNGLTWTKTSLPVCSPVDFSVDVYNSLGYQRYWLATDQATYLSYDMTNFRAYTATTDGLAGNSSAQIYSGGLIWVANNGTGGLTRMGFDGN